MKSKVYLIPETQEEFRILREELQLDRFIIDDIKSTYGPPYVQGRFQCTVEQFEAIQQRINQISNVHSSIAATSTKSD